MFNVHIYIYTDLSITFYDCILSKYLLNLKRKRIGPYCKGFYLYSTIILIFQFLFSTVFLRVLCKGLSMVSV